MTAEGRRLRWEPGQGQFFERNRTVQLVIDPATGEIVEANPAACGFYGYTHQQITGLHIWQINMLPPEKVRIAMTRAIEDWSEPLLFPHRLASGELRLVEVHTGPLQVEGRCYLHSLIFDVTGRQRAEAALQRQMTAIESSMDGVAILDTEDRLVFANHAHARIYGYETASDLLGHTWRVLYPEDECERFAREVMPALRRAGRWRGEGVGRRRDGSTFAQELSLSTLPDGGMVCVVRDTTERKAAEQALRASEERYRGILASIEDGYYEADLAGNFTFLNDALGRLLGLSPQAGVGVNHREYADPTNARRMERDFREVFRTGRPVQNAEWEVLRRDGERRTVAASLSLIRGATGQPEGFRGIVRDVSERRRAELALRDSEERFRTLAQTAPCAIVIYREDQFLYANDAALDITGRTREELQQMQFWDLVAPDLRETLRERGLARLRENETPPARYELRILRPDGSARWLDYSVSLINFAGAAAILGTAFDISERKLAEEQIRHLAYHDALTGLPNRLLFRDRLEVAVAQAHRDQRKVAVLFLDLDRFKAINDSLGHSQGDRLLQDVTRRLEGCVREGDTVARLSGDEFTLILPGVEQPLDAAKAAEKILEVLRQPFELKQREVFVTASMGISLYPHDGSDAEALLKNADTAMYRAKEQGRDTYQLYAPAMNARALERLALENNLHRAFLQQELEIFYQPLWDRNGALHGVEALLRWQHQGRFIPPDEFIPVAELTGLIVPIGVWMLREVCLRARAWQRGGHPQLCISINLSARQFQQVDLAAQVRSVLEETGLPPHTLDLEITETSAMQNSELALETLRQVKALGVRLSIDDFGTGYSSLAYLKHLPFDALKIDQAFVQDVASDPRDAAIVSAMIEIAHALGREVVAEGVETEAQRDFLAARGCDRMQGFLFSAALPPHELEALLARTGPAPARPRVPASPLQPSQE